MRLRLASICLLLVLLVIFAGLYAIVVLVSIFWPAGPLPAPTLDPDYRTSIQIEGELKGVLATGPPSGRCQAPSRPRFRGKDLLDRAVYEQFYRDYAGAQQPLCNGLVVEVGAGNGLDHSLSYFFEQDLQWRSICVEGDPLEFARLRGNRPRCANMPMAVADSRRLSTFVQLDGGRGGIMELLDSKRLRKDLANSRGSGRSGSKSSSRDFPTALVETIELGELLLALGLVQVDVLSLSIEGGEQEVVELFPFQLIDVSVVVVGCKDVFYKKNTAVALRMEEVGFEKVKETKETRVYASKSFLQRRAANGGA